MSYSKYALVLDMALSRYAKFSIQDVLLVDGSSK